MEEIESSEVIEQPAVAVQEEPESPAAVSYSQEQLDEAVRLSVQQAIQYAQPAPSPSSVDPMDEITDELFSDPKAALTKYGNLIKAQAREEARAEYAPQLQSLAQERVLNDISGGDKNAKDYFNSKFSNQLAGLKDASPEVLEVFRLAAKQIASDKTPRPLQVGSPGYSEPAPQISDSLRREIQEMKAITGVQMDDKDLV